MTAVVHLLPGDVVHNGSLHATFVAQTRHPLWPSLQLVIWRMPGGDWSHDALRPGQDVGTVERATTEEREQRLRSALLGRERR